MITALPQSSPEDVAAAFARAREAQKVWSQWPLRKRLNIVPRSHHYADHLFVIVHGPHRAEALGDAVQQECVAHTGSGGRDGGGAPAFRRPPVECAAWYEGAAREVSVGTAGMTPVQR